MAISARTLILEHTFNLNLDDVYTTVANFERFADFHPVMKSVKIIFDNSSVSKEYAVAEEIRLLGFVVMRPKYKATVIEVQKRMHVQYSSQVKKGIFLRINFYFTQEGSITKIREQIELYGNPLITAVFLKILKKAHLKTFENFRIH